MSKLAVSVLIMGLVTTSVWGAGRDPQSIDLDAVLSQYASADCCWDQVEFRAQTQPDAGASGESRLLLASVLAGIGSR